MKVSKRDGLIEEYDFRKIKRAAERAFASLDRTMTEEFCIQLATRLDKFTAKYTSADGTDKPIPIEKIQDTLKKFLKKTGNKDVADAFTEYREWRNNVRNQRSELMQSIVDKLQGKNIENQNANVDEMSFGGRKGEASSILTSDYALNNCMTKMSRDNHIKGRIYIHDRDSYALGMHNCLTVPFDKILENGFVTRQGDVRKPNCISTACQLIAVIFQIQSQQQFGGVSASHIDWTMVPYIRKSFQKHYLMHYIESCDEFYKLDFERMERQQLKKWVTKQVEKFFMVTGLEDDDFRFDNKERLDPVYYQCAMYETRKETEQAVEGLYHNLNHLQSRSGNQLKLWLAA